MHKFAVFAMLLSFFLSCSASSSLADCVSLTATEKISNWSGEPDDDDIKKLQNKARLETWRLYVKNLESRFVKAYLQKQPEIDQSYRSFIISEDFKKQWDSSSNTLTVQSCIQFNVEKLQASLKVGPDIQTGTGSAIVSLFVAREATNEKSFAANTTESSSNTTQSKRNSGEFQNNNISGSSAGYTSKSFDQQKQANSRSSSGTTELKGPTISYRKIASGAADGAMSSIIVKAGYEPTDYKLIANEPECDGVKENIIFAQFTANEEPSGEIVTKIMKSAKKCDQKFFAFGTMTADQGRRDLQTGLQIVSVRIQGKVYDLRHRFPRKVADIAPQQFQGLGPSQETARTNALTKAGAEAGRLITGFLKDKGIR